MLKDDSYKTGTSSPICDCEHFLLQCSNYTAARKVIFERIEALGLFSHDQFHTNVNEHLLLAPSDGCNITKKDDRQIIDALFEYLTTVERSI